MALSVQSSGTKRVPQRSSIVRMIALIVSIGVAIRTLLRIWGATSRCIRPQVLPSSSEPDIQQRIKSGRITWWAPILMLVARPVFALVAQLVVATGFRLRRHPKPLREAGRWWMVSGTIIDLLSLGTLIWLTRREGIRVVDLLNMRRERLGRDVVLGLGNLVAMAPAVGIGAALTRLFYGPSGEPPQVTVVRGLPRVAAVYSVLVWPVIWGITEETIYVGYVLPRLEVLTGNTSVSVALVSAVWALQHESLPLLPNRRYLVYRPLSALPVALTASLLSLFEGRRLLPLIVPHWAANAASALLAALPQRARNRSSHVEKYKRS